MSAAPPENFLVEVLQELPATVIAQSASSMDMIVEIGNVTVVGQTVTPSIIEVAVVPPVGAGIKQIEAIPFTRQGPLTTVTSGTEYPIGPGAFTLDSIAARVAVAPVGADVVLDILKNDVSIFAAPANRPTIAAGTNSAVVGTFDTVMLAEGDYIEVIITQVGSTSPGESLVVSIRLTRIV